MRLQVPSSETINRMPSRYKQSFVSFLLVKTLALSNYSSPIVTLPNGSFQGKVVGNLVEYLGIPFAAPPYVCTTRRILITDMQPSTGELRFGLPQPPLPFDGIRQATTFGAACPQLNMTISSNATLLRDYNFFSDILEISEDCMVPVILESFR